MSILKIGLYILPFVLAAVVGYFALGIGLGIEVGPVTTANILVAFALLIAAFNVGWIVAYKSK